MRARSAMVAFLLFALPAMATPAPVRSDMSACQARLERARDHLIDLGFAPTTDKDTRRWLVVEAAPDTVQLKLELRASADGPATFYQLNVQHRRRVGVEATSWRVQRGRHCCDEHATPDDHLHEQRWTRARPPLVATVLVVEFEAALHDPAATRWREMFTEVARKAADDCLAHRE